MAISAALSNALSGLRVTQQSVDVLSRNVANSGVSGYHAQSLVQEDRNSGSGSLVTSTAVSRAFNSVLQRQYNSGLSEAGYASVQAAFLGQLETFLGMPGDATSLDTVYANFEAAMSALATSPDDYATRAGVISTASALVDTLNSLSSSVQTLRQETESRISSTVHQLNSDMARLAEVNQKLVDASITDGARATLLDERDRLVTSISEQVDVNVQYRDNDTVSVMTQSGASLVDMQAARFDFTSAGKLSASSFYNTDDAESGVGKLTLTSAGGLELDVVGQKITRSGSLAALISLRDETLVDAQAQLDEIAAALASAFSTVETDGTAAVDGAAAGFEIDLADLQAGNSFTLNYTESGEDKTVRVVRVDDASALPMDYIGEDGVRVLGIDFSSGVAAAATDIGTALGAGLAVSNPSGDVLRILDDGALGTTDVSSLTAATTVTANQGAGLGINLFVDSDGSAFTNSLDGTDQLIGFASRISLNPEIQNDSSLLVQYDASSSLGDDARAVHLLDRIQTLNNSGVHSASGLNGAFKLSGTISEMIAQTLNYQGSVAEAAQSRDNNASTVMETLDLRIEDEYGVDIDTEMARLMELQNAYAANGRVISAVQELLNALMSI